jgi:hypothetical protein
LWYINYSKEEARSFLQEEFGWTYYGGHHLENRMTAFHHSYYTPTKFGIDQRNNSLSASVRAGLITRAEAIEEYARPPHIEDELFEYFLKRMNLSNRDFHQIMHGPPRTYRDFKSYKKRFETLRPLFKLLYRAELVPKSFYIKYCSKSEI